MKKWMKVFLIILMFLFIIYLILYLYTSKSNVEKIVDKDNYCKQTSDCVKVRMNSCNLDCSYYVNYEKESKLGRIKTLNFIVHPIDSFLCINDCAGTIPECINNRCVAKRV